MIDMDVHGGTGRGGRVPPFAVQERMHQRQGNASDFHIDDPGSTFGQTFNSSVSDRHNTLPPG